MVSNSYYDVLAKCVELSNNAESRASLNYDISEALISFKEAFEKYEEVVLSTISVDSDEFKEAYNKMVAQYLILEKLISSSVPTYRSIVKDRRDLDFINGFLYHSVLGTKMYMIIASHEKILKDDMNTLVELVKTRNFITLSLSDSEREIVKICIDIFYQYIDNANEQG